MAAAAGAPPGFFSFLKHGVLVPARGRGVFLPLLALTAALAGALLLANSLAVQPRAVAALLDADALSRADPASAAYPKLVRRFRDDLRGSRRRRRVRRRRGGRRSAIKIATVFGAVAAFSPPAARTAAPPCPGSSARRGGTCGGPC